MTQEEKIKYMAIAASICHFHLKEQEMDLLVSLYDLILEKKGDADLKAIARIQLEVNERADAIIDLPETGQK